MNRFLGLALLFLTSCKVGPDHCVPASPVPEEWQAPPVEVISSSEPKDIRKLFDDPLLNGCLDKLACQNLDVRIAAARVCQAYALRQISSARLMPFVDARTAYNAAKPAGGILEGGAGAMGGGGGALAGIPLDIKQQNFIADFDAFWELDLFGRTRREVESATASIQIEAAHWHDALLSLTAEFARNYLELRRIQQNLELLNAERTMLKKKIVVMEERLNSGLDTEMDLLETRKELDGLLAEAPLLEAKELSQMYRLAFLLGSPPAALLGELQASPEIPQTAQEVPVGFPSSMLRRRPDIRAAEREVAQATAELGVAVADLFPKFTLRGNYGYQNLHLGQAKGSGESWGYGGDLLTPLFHGGALRANVRRHQWIRQEAFLSYERAVLRALEEAESSISAWIKSRNAFEERNRAFQRSQELLRHRKALFEEGLADQMQLIDQQLQTLRAEREKVNQEAAAATHLVALYKALGGNNSLTSTERMK